MSDRFFLDTNIFVYSFDRSAVMKAQKGHAIDLQHLEDAEGNYQLLRYS